MTETEIEAYIKEEAVAFQRSLLDFSKLSEGYIDFDPASPGPGPMIDRLKERLKAKFVGKDSQINEHCKRIHETCAYQAPEMLPYVLATRFKGMAEALK